MINQILSEKHLFFFSEYHGLWNKYLVKKSGKKFYFSSVPSWKIKQCRSCSSFVKSYLSIYRFKGENKFSFYPPVCCFLNYRYCLCCCTNLSVCKMLRWRPLQAGVLTTTQLNPLTAHSEVSLKIPRHCHCSELAWPLKSCQFIMMVTGLTCTATRELH